MYDVVKHMIVFSKVQGLILAVMHEKELGKKSKCVAEGASFPKIKLASDFRLLSCAAS
jgi:hypothetical protein